jgi:hypothetical protein
MKRAVLFGLLAIASFTSTTSAVPIDGKAIIATGGHVVATYMGTTAGYTDDLYLYSPTNNIGLIFSNHTSPVGSQVDLGDFLAGTELIFQLYVVNTGLTFYSGDPSRNPDGLAHARVDDEYGSGLALVQFEDLFGTPEGVNGFNDLGFTFTNVKSETTNVPDAGSTAGLLGLGFLGVAAIRRKLATA